ncbi:hypothetical protein [Variovorax sp. J22R115]|uniref:hypothetical protein n=1 Tax=Variovorax sp. J22R115 TaxID=3053509 RepID=UPI0025789CFE|nr:hypothetical protein [Variovorax sp. J22R115]MDM0053819.1 hypothetical protein [Variovorax sp. J22R115]
MSKTTKFSDEVSSPGHASAATGSPRPKAASPDMAFVWPLKTRTLWELTPGYVRQSEFGFTQYWAGAELLSPVYFLAECTAEISNGKVETTTFITYDVTYAEDYLKDGPAPTSSRILVLKRGSGSRESMLGEVSKVLRCTVTGALVIKLSGGELISDGNEPATDSKGLHHFEVIYPKLVRPKLEVRMGPIFKWKE